MLKIGNSTLTLKSSCLIENGPDVFPLREHAQSYLSLIGFKLARKGKNGYISDNMEPIREPAKVLFRHDPL
jgi:hypothetical protein